MIRRPTCVTCAGPIGKFYDLGYYFKITHFRGLIRKNDIPYFICVTLIFTFIFIENYDHACMLSATGLLDAGRIPQGNKSPIHGLQGLGMERVHIGIKDYITSLVESKFMNESIHM